MDKPNVLECVTHLMNNGRIKLLDESNALVF